MRYTVFMGALGVGLALVSCNKVPAEQDNAAASAPAGDEVHIETPVVNQDVLEGNWRQLKGKVKEKWAKLTDDDLGAAEGNAEYLAGKLQERYGITKAEADRQVKEFEHELRE